MGIDNGGVEDHTSNQPSWHLFDVRDLNAIPLPDADSEEKQTER